MRSSVMVPILAAGLTVAGVVAARVSAAARDAAMPTCTVTQFVMAPTSVGAKNNSLDLVMGDSNGQCFGDYAFVGVTAASLGFADVTKNNYGELAAALKHWNSVDGVPAVSEWVNLAPEVAAGMQAAGINPTMFLQWLNEYDGAGTVNHPVMPSTWPPFLPKGLVADPATIAGGTADQTVQAPKPTAPPQDASEPALTHAHLPDATVSTTVASATTGVQGPAAVVSTTAEMSGAAVAASTKTTSLTAPAPVSGSPASMTPSVAVTTDRVTVPCVVVSTCREAVVAHDRWQGAPWYAKAAMQLWWHRHLVSAIVVFVTAAVLGVRGLITRRRNRAWDGHLRGLR